MERNPLTLLLGNGSLEKNVEGLAGYVATGVVMLVVGILKFPGEMDT